MCGRIVFITTSPISRLFSEKVDFNGFRALGLETILLDASPLFYSSELLKAYYAGEKTYQFNDIETITVDSEEAAFQMLKTLGNGDVVWHLSRFFKSVDDDFIFNALNCKKVPYYLQHFDAMVPQVDFLRIMRMRIRMRYQKYQSRKLKPCAVIGSGTYSRLQSEMLYPNSKFISIPSVKVTWNESEKLIEGDYILFVDESVEYAPDAKLLNYSISSDIEGYYGRMNSLFKTIESWLGKPVVIAASGKYKYQHDRFEGRPVIYGKTLSLIQHASLVVGHMSLALEQCLISEIPFLIVDDQSFTDVKRDGFHASLLNHIRRPVLNTDVTQDVLVRCATPDMAKMRFLIQSFLREEDAFEFYHEAVAADFKKTLIEGWTGK